MFVSKDQPIPDTHFTPSSSLFNYPTNNHFNKMKDGKGVYCTFQVSNNSEEIGGSGNMGRYVHFALVPPSVKLPKDKP